MIKSVLKKVYTARDEILQGYPGGRPDHPEFDNHDAGFVNNQDGIQVDLRRLLLLRLGQDTLSQVGTEVRARKCACFTK